MARSRGDGGCGCILLFIVLFFLYDTVSSCMSDDQGATYTPTRAPAPTFSFPLPPMPPGHACRDGWISHSVGRGTCSHHGGEL